MCIIVDACCANSLGNADWPQAHLIRDWVRGGGKIVSGGLLQRELKNTALQALLVQWSASGRLINKDPTEIKIEEEKLDRSKVKSNDLHVIALARLSGAKVIVTRDQDLMYDLKKSPEIGKARKIYPMGEKPAKNLKVHRGVLRNAGCV